MTQKKIAELFGVQRPAITKHIKNIVSNGELELDSVSSILEHAADDGKTKIRRLKNLVGFLRIHSLLMLYFLVPIQKQRSLGSTLELFEYFFGGYIFLSVFSSGESQSDLADDKVLEMGWRGIRFNVSHVGKGTKKKLDQQLRVNCDALKVLHLIRTTIFLTAKTILTNLKDFQYSAPQPK